MSEEAMPEDAGTEELVAEEPRRSHLDDEALNAVLDGEGGPADAAHAHACSRCSVRLERFRRVAVAVAVPVESVAPERRRAAVTSAMQLGRQPGGTQPGGTQPADTLTKADGAAASSGNQAAPGDRNVVVVDPRRRRRRQAVGWVAAAAGVAALAVAVPLLDPVTGGMSGEDRATRATEESPGAGGSEADTCGACGSVLDRAPTDGGDLGTLDRGALDALAQRLGHDLSLPETSNEPGQGRLDASPPPEATSSGPTEQAARGQAASPPPPPPVRPPPESVGRCEAAARKRDAGLGPLGYSARARFGGVDAVVLGFGPAAADTPTSPRSVVLVLAVRTCTELASASA